MHAPRTRHLILAAILVATIVGCGAPAKTKTQKEAAQAQWNGTRASVLFSLASDQYRAGNFDKCRQTIGQATALDPTSPRLLVLSARLDIEDARLDAAERTLRLAATLDAKNAEIDYLQGVVQQRWQRPGAALERYASAAVKKPDDVAFPLAAAEMLVALDRRPEATKLLLSRVVYFEHSAAIRDAIAQLLQQSGALTQAVEFYRQASALDGEDAGIRERLGVALYQAGQWREAIAQLDRVAAVAATRTPGSDRATATSEATPRVDLMLAAAECELALDDAAAARRRFEDVRVIEPANADAWLGVAKASLALSDLRRAEAAATRAVTLRPQSVDAQVVLGYVLMKQGRDDQAAAAFARASGSDPTDTVSLNLQGVVAARQGHGASAATYYRRALAIDPTDAMASRLLATIAE